MPTVILAGYNVDVEVLEALRRGEAAGDALTPETISAAYARISRDPSPVTELRRRARAQVGRSRASNQKIVFEMGHHSIAEHAAFNFDLLDVSRLAIEAIESHRLASYTEKSQRYIRIGEDLAVPAEVTDAGLEAPFRAYGERCFGRYKTLLDGLVGRGIDEKLAGEDARYVLPLATTGQLGMTVNARTLERMILRFSAHPLHEVRALGGLLLDQARPIAPSLLLFYEPGPYELRRAADVADAVDSMRPTVNRPLAAGAPEVPSGRATVNPSPVTLLHSTPDGDARILAALAQPSLGGSAEDALAFVLALDDTGRGRLFDATTRHLGIHDALPRELEHGVMTFEVVTSAAAFGQLKRHRMSSQTPMPYDPGLGLTVPPAVEGAGLAGVVVEAAADAEATFASLGGPAAPVAAYALLNAHRRRVLLTLNLRELYHVSRLREDAHAQWDIRQIAGEMSCQARGAFPVCGALLGGKDKVALG
jgi:flavin-dependent thymidylate synthase